jgi:hypothetical protein
VVFLIRIVGECNPFFCYFESANPATLKRNVVDKLADFSGKDLKYRPPNASINYQAVMEIIS